MPESASAFDDYNQIEFKLTQTNCGCSVNESTGQPGNFNVTQHLGRLYFSWVDKVSLLDGGLNQCFKLLTVPDRP